MTLSAPTVLVTPTPEGVVSRTQNLRSYYIHFWAICIWIWICWNLLRKSWFCI